jgi:hypothetical protein
VCRVLCRGVTFWTSVKSGHMGQPVFARLLGADKSSVAQWERGAKRPSRPAFRLLEVLDPDKPDGPIVQVRRSMAAGPA